MIVERIIIRTMSYLSVTDKWRVYNLSNKFATILCYIKEYVKEKQAAQEESIKTKT